MSTGRKRAATAKIVLDSFALVSLFHREPGWKAVQRALYAQQAGGARAWLSCIKHGYPSPHAPASAAASR